MDATRLEFQNLEAYRLTRAQLERKYQWDFESPTLGLENGVLLPEVADSIREQPEAQHSLTEEFETILKEIHSLRTDVFPEGDSNRWPLPCNIKRLVLNAQKLHGIDPHHTVSTVSPSHVVSEVYSFADCVQRPTQCNDCSGLILRSTNC